MALTDDIGRVASICHRVRPFSLRFDSENNLHCWESDHVASQHIKQPVELIKICARCSVWRYVRICISIAPTVRAIRAERWIFIECWVAQSQIIIRIVTERQSERHSTIITMRERTQDARARTLERKLDWLIRIHFPFPASLWPDSAYLNFSNLFPTHPRSRNCKRI